MSLSTGRWPTVREPRRLAEEVIPIREGVRPATDFGRELLDFCTTKITSFTEDYATPPTTIALVLSGEKDGRKFTDAYIWDAAEKRTKLETCSLASAVLMKRAICDG
jgi:hypothetical protein